MFAAQREPTVVATPLAERLFLHLLNEIAKITHGANQTRLLGFFLPVGCHRERFEVVLDSVASVSFGFEQIEGHPDIAAYHISFRVDRQRSKYVSNKRTHEVPPDVGEELRLSRKLNNAEKGRLVWL
jgi:hypothetical protein